MRDEHADGRFDLLGSRPQHRPVGRGGADRPVNDMIDPVALEAEDLREATPNLIDAHHAPQGLRPVEIGKLGGGDRHRIEIIMPELPGSMTEGGIETEVRAVGIPFPHRRTVGDDGFFGSYPLTRSEQENTVRTFIAQGFFTQHRRGVCTQCQGG